MGGELRAGQHAPGADGASSIETGVAGLVLRRNNPEGPWRLVHEGTGLAVSRSAVSADRRVLVRLAQQLAPLADWRAKELSIPGPALRQAVEEAARRCGLSLPPVTVGAPATGSGPAEAGAAEDAQDDLELLRRVLHLVHGAVPPGLFASAISELDQAERARLRQLILGPDGGGVVKPIPTAKTPPSRLARRPPAPAPRPKPSRGSAAG